MDSKQFTQEFEQCRPQLRSYLLRMTDKHIPDFDVPFERFAADPKQEAEKIATRE